MATEKELLSRVRNKHDIETNWLEATTFIPKAGEFIIYDAETENDPIPTKEGYARTFRYDAPRLKVGDGKTNVIDLPFTTAEIAGDVAYIDETDNIGITVPTDNIIINANNIKFAMQTYEGTGKYRIVGPSEMLNYPYDINKLTFDFIPLVMEVWGHRQATFKLWDRGFFE